MGTRKKTRKVNPLIRAMLWWIPPLYKAYMGFVLLTSKRVFYNFDSVKKLQAEAKNILAAAWHQDLILGPFTFRHYNIVTMASKGDLGEIMASILKRIGYTGIRGSSSLGGSEALAEIIEYFHTNDRIFCALAADGSRGPFQKIKKGIIVIAKECGAPIYPVKTWARWKIFLPTWDRALVPFPFNECVYFCGEPVYVPSDATLEVIEAKRQELEDNLMKLVKRAEEYYTKKSTRTEYPNESKVVQYGMSAPLDY